MPIAVEARQIELLAVGRRRLQDHLELVIVLQPVGVLAVAAVGRPARGLDIGGAPRLGPERAQRRRRMKGAGAHLDIIGLQDHAALPRPEILQLEDQRLKAHGRASGTRPASARPRAVGPAAGRRAAPRHRRRRPRRRPDPRPGAPGAARRAPARQLARRAVQPAIADPDRGEHQDQNDELRETRTSARFTGLPGTGSRNARLRSGSTLSPMRQRRECTSTLTARTGPQQPRFDPVGEIGDRGRRARARQTAAGPRTAAAARPRSGAACTLSP